MRKGIFILVLSLILILCLLYAYSGFKWQQILKETGGETANLAGAGFFVTKILLDIRGLVLFILTLIALCTGILWLGLQISDRALHKLRNALITVANGDFEFKLPVKGKSLNARLFGEFNHMVKNFRKKLAMQKYVSKSTVNMIDNLKTGEFSQEPERRTQTIFFSDVRGFTSYSEKNDPFRVVLTINQIFNLQAEVINKHEGDIDKFVGDEIMAVFPTPGKAFKAAWEIQQKMNTYNRNNPTPLPIGIGINTGEAVVGAIGGGDALDWTCIGNTVNEAARLCSMAPGGKIYMTESSFKKLRTSKPYKEEEHKIKGLKNAMKIFIF